MIVIKKPKIFLLFFLFNFMFFFDAYAEEYTKFDVSVVDGLNRHLEGTTIKIYRPGETTKGEVIKEFLTDKSGRFKTIIYENRNNLALSFSKKGYESLYYGLEQMSSLARFNRAIGGEYFKNWSTEHAGWRKNVRTTIVLERKLDLSEIDDLLNLKGEKLEVALDEILTATYREDNGEKMGVFVVLEALFKIEDHISEALKNALLDLEINWRMEEFYSLITDPKQVKDAWIRRHQSQEFIAVSSTSLDEAIELAAPQIADKSKGDKLKVDSKIFNRNKDKVLVNCTVTRIGPMGKYGPLKHSGGYYFLFYKIDDLLWTLQVITDTWVS